MSVLLAAAAAAAAALRTTPQCFKHHLVPKLNGAHAKVLAVFTEADLACDHAAIEALNDDPGIDKWIAKRPIDFSEATSLRRCRRGARSSMSLEGLEAESDSVGPGIYGGRVQRDARGGIIIGKQFQEHNSLPGPVYAGGGYTELSQAIRKGPLEVEAALEAAPEMAFEISTGGATPLHVCAMSRVGQQSMQRLIDARHGADLDALDTWGYTALQRCATNGLAAGAMALVAAGASHSRPSGLDGRGESARQLALRLRAFGVLKVFQQYELWQGMALPDGEIEL
jgi:ankyrin repeat protein